MCKCRQRRKEEILPETTNLDNHEQFVRGEDHDVEREDDADVDDGATDHTADLEPGESFTTIGGSSPGRPDTPKSTADEHEFLDVDEALGQSGFGGDLADGFDEPRITLSTGAAAADSLSPVGLGFQEGGATVWEEASLGASSMSPAYAQAGMMPDSLSPSGSLSCLLSGTSHNS